MARRRRLAYIQHVSMCSAAGGHRAFALIQISRKRKRGSGEAKAAVHLHFRPPRLHIVSLAAGLTRELVTHASHQRVRPRSGASWSLGIPRDHFICVVISPADPAPLVIFYLWCHPVVIIHSHTCYQLLAYWLARERERERERATDRRRRSVRVLNCMTFPPDLMKRRPQSRVACPFSLSGLLWMSRWPPTVTSAATWLRGGPAREAWGGPCTPFASVMLSSNAQPQAERTTYFFILFSKGGGRSRDSVVNFDCGLTTEALQTHTHTPVTSALYLCL